MVATYNLFGRQIGSHWLAIGTLALTFGGSAFAMRGDNKAQKAATPPLNAGSKDEENFIQEFLQQVEQEDKSNKAKAGAGH